jgi:hypothetical protein
MSGNGTPEGKVSLTWALLLALGVGIAGTIVAFFGILTQFAVTCTTGTDGRRKAWLEERRKPRRQTKLPDRYAVAGLMSG